MARVLSPRVLRTLAPLSAASGLAAAADRLYVIADDRDTLASFPRQGAGPPRLIAGARTTTDVLGKDVKADFEALVALPGGGLLALGSGATAARHTGVLWPAPELGVPARMVELSALHAALPLPDVNLEGACVSGNHLVLAQRGNGPGGADALVVCALAPFLDAVRSGAPVPAEALEAINPVAGLGAVDGVPLTLTDLAALPDGRLLATAVAEGGGSTYDDGKCAGAAVALLRADGHVLRVEPLGNPWKVEGLLAAPRGEGTVDLLLCADPDDPTAVAPLLGVSFRL